MEGPRASRGGVAGIAFFPKHRFPFNKPLPCDPLLRGSRSQVPQGRGRLPNRWRTVFANYAISVSHGQYNAIAAGELRFLVGLKPTAGYWSSVVGPLHWSMAFAKCYARSYG